MSDPKPEAFFEIDADATSAPASQNVPLCPAEKDSISEAPPSALRNTLRDGGLRREPDSPMRSREDAMGQFSDCDRLSVSQLDSRRGTAEADADPAAAFKRLRLDVSPYHGFPAHARDPG